MPSRKQRKRRAKELRHEYELVLVDEDGEERPVEAAELRAEKTTGKGKTVSKSAPARSKSGKPIREVQPPSWSRIGKRGGFVAVLLFVVLGYVGRGRPLADTLIPTMFYTALSIPFFYLLDRAQYNQYLKRTGQQPAPRPANARAPKSEQDEGESKGPVASLRRALRR